MEFAALQLSGIGEISPFFKKIRTKTCDYTVGGMFMWRDFYRMEYAVSDGVFYSRLHSAHGARYYNLPIADDIPAALRGFREATGEAAPTFCTIPEEYLSVFREIFPGCGVSYQEEFSDYLFRYDDLAGLHGKKYSGQRNQISQFKRANEDWSFTPLGEDMLGEVREFFLRKYLPESADGAYEREENRKVLEVLDNFRAYGFSGGVLKAGGAVVGFSLGEIIGDTLYVHIEKADRGCKGAYQMLVNQFAAAQRQEQLLYINREEDMGDPGLRASKQSYHPVALLKKFVVRVDNHEAC